MPTNPFIKLMDTARNLRVNVSEITRDLDLPSDIFLTTDDLIMGGVSPYSVHRSLEDNSENPSCSCESCRSTRSQDIITSALDCEELKAKFRFLAPMRNGRGPSMSMPYDVNHLPMMDRRMLIRSYAVNVLTENSGSNGHYGIYRKQDVRYACDAHLKSCSKCGEKLGLLICPDYQQDGNPGPLWVMANGDLLCNACFKESDYYECHYCHSVIAKPKDADDNHDDAPQDTGAGIVCGSCYDEYFDICADCGKVLAKDDMRWMEEDDEYLCYDCFDRAYVICSSCEVILSRDDGTETQHGMVCSDCADEYYTECSQCEDMARTSDGVWRGEHRDEFICSGCAGNDSDADGLVMSHAYKPRARFYKLATEAGESKSPGATQFFGFELETENIHNATNPDLMCQKSMDFWDNEKAPGLIYYKHDGSLNYGIEMVSHPISWGWFLTHRQSLEGWLKLIQANGYRSFNTKTCGLHIHMNKTAFNGQRMYKFMKFFHENGQFIYTMSGRRTHDEMNQWAAIDDEGAEKKNLAYEAKTKLKKKFGRYWAVNLEPNKTIEIRIFKGTLKPSSFFRAFEFLRSLYLFTENGVASIANTNLARYLRFVSTLDDRDFGGLKQLTASMRQEGDTSPADGEGD